MTKKRIICAFSLHPHNCRRQQSLMSDESDNCQDTDFIATLLNWHKYWIFYTKQYFNIYWKCVQCSDVNDNWPITDQKQSILFVCFFFLFSKWQIIRRIITHFYLHLYFLQPIGTILINKIWQLSGHILLACHAEKFKQ